MCFSLMKLTGIFNVQAKKKTCSDKNMIWLTSMWRVFTLKSPSYLTPARGLRVCEPVWWIVINSQFSRHMQKTSLGAFLIQTIPCSCKRFGVGHNVMSYESRSSNALCRLHFHLSICKHAARIFSLWNLENKSRVGPRDWLLNYVRENHYLNLIQGFGWNGPPPPISSKSMDWIKVLTLGGSGGLSSILTCPTLSRFYLFPFKKRLLSKFDFIKGDKRDWILPIEDKCL